LGMGDLAYPGLAGCDRGGGAIRTSRTSTGVGTAGTSPACRRLATTVGRGDDGSPAASPACRRLATTDRRPRAVPRMYGADPLRPVKIKASTGGLSRGFRRPAWSRDAQALLDMLPGFSPGR
jgi:hypothetical protein